jgi:hypothetical protein
VTRINRPVDVAPGFFTQTGESEMATVKFGDVGEFIEELKRDAANVERSIVRLTYRWRSADPSPIRSMSVVASAVIGGHIVTLEERCGSYFPDTSDAQEVAAAAAKKLGAIEAAAKELGLEVRAGVFETA